jgi:hypothetical protein
MPPGSPTDRVAEADGPTSPSGDSITHLTAPTTSRVPHAGMTTLASPSAPLAALMTLASTYTPRVAPTTPPAASSMTPISPPATQLVPRVLSAGAVPVSPILKSVRATLTDPHWRAAREEEYAALMTNMMRTSPAQIRPY